MPENQDTILPPSRTSRTTRSRKSTAPSSAETSAQAPVSSSTPAADVTASESAAPRPRATRARRATALTTQDDTTSAQPAAEPATSAAPTRRRTSRSTAATQAAMTATSPEASIEAPAEAPAKPTRRSARTTRAAKAAQVAPAETAEPSVPSAPVVGERQTEPMSAWTSAESGVAPTAAEAPAAPLRRRFDSGRRGPYGRAGNPPAIPTEQAPQETPPMDRPFGQPTTPAANGMYGTNGTNGADSSQGGYQPGGRGASRAAIPYSPGGRGAEHRGRGETGREPGRQPRQPQYPQQPQLPPQYPAANYPGGQRPQGRDDQRGGQPYTVYSPAAPYAPAEPYGQRGQRGQQDQSRGRGGRGGQGYPQQGGYPETQGSHGRAYPQDQRDQRDQRDRGDQRRQGGRHGEQGYPQQGGYPQDRQDRRGGATRGQPGQGRGRGGREQMSLPPIYTNPNAPMDQRYTPYAPVAPRNQPPAPQQHVRTVEVAGMVFPSGHGAATADILDERTLQTLGRITLDDMRRWGLRSGDVIRGQVEERGSRRSLVNLDTVNGDAPESARERPHFDQLTATFPDRRVRLEQAARPISARIIDLFAPLGFGSRALIVAPPKTGKTTLIREAAEAVLLGYPDAVVMAVLVGERPEEVTDLRSRLEPRGGHVYAASFDESTERHAWLTQVAVERAKRVAESGRDAFMVLDSLTRLARAENLAARGGGRTLSGGIDAQALDTGRRAFGAARNLEEGGSITILATVLVDTGSRQDDVVYEEFKGTGNMELHLSRELAQRRLFPAVDAVKSGTRREEMLLTPEELHAATALRRRLADLPVQQATQQLLGVMERTPSNAALIKAIEASGWSTTR